MIDLPESISALSSLRQLSVSCTTPRRVLLGFNSLIHLQQLNLHGCMTLSSLPHGMSRLSSLLQLKLINCRLWALPEEFGGIRSLQKLHISCVPLTALPDSFRCLSRLQHLHMHFCNLSVFPPNFGNLASLSIIDGSHLTSLLPTLGSLGSLTRLLINFCTTFASLKHKQSAT